MSDHRKPSRKQPAFPPITASCGLVNTGNTCYVNSALQCLNSIPELVEWALEQPAPIASENVIDSYITLVQSMYSGQYKAVDARELKDWVTFSAPIFSGTGQKDAHEFMNSLLNAFESIEPSSFLASLFRINTQSTVIGNFCQHRHATEGTTTFLSLPMPDIRSSNHREIPLEGLIKDFCQVEDMVGDYYCQQCHHYQSAHQETLIIDPLPRTLVIQLKRFPFIETDRKIETFVRYQLKYRNLFSSNDFYALTAIINHSGSLSSGHYTTTARDHRDNRWYRYDDQYVDEIDQNDIPSALITRQAYVLLYCKQNRPDLTISTAF